MSLPLSAGLLSFGVPFRQSRLLNPTRRRSSKQNSSNPTHVKFLKCIRIRESLSCVGDGPHVDYRGALLILFVLLNNLLFVTRKSRICSVVLLAPPTET